VVYTVPELLLVMTHLWRCIRVPTVLPYPRRRHQRTEVLYARHDGAPTRPRTRSRATAPRQQAVQVRLQRRMVVRILQHRSLVLRCCILGTASCFLLTRGAEKEVAHRSTAHQGNWSQVITTDKEQPVHVDRLVHQ